MQLIAYLKDLPIFEGSHQPLPVIQSKLVSLKPLPEFVLGPAYILRWSVIPRVVVGLGGVDDYSDIWGRLLDAGLRPASLLKDFYQGYLSSHGALWSRQYALQHTRMHHPDQLRPARKGETELTFEMFNREWAPVWTPTTRPCLY
jgi:hypothetical protein